MLNCPKTEVSSAVCGTHDNIFTPQYAKFAEQHNNQVRMRSGQGGYIPYYLKTTYPAIEFMIIDD